MAEAMTHLQQETDEWVLEQLQFARQHKLNVALQVDPEFQILVSGEKDLYLISPLDPAVRPMENRSVESFRNQSLRKDDPDLPLLMEKGRPLGELLWNTAWRAAREGLLEGCRRNDVVSLREWPNLTRMEHSRNATRIAALLSTRPTSLVLASRILGLEEDEVSRFYCAALSAGYAEPVNRAEPAESQEPPRRPGQLQLVRSLFERLAGVRKASVS